MTRILISLDPAAIEEIGRAAELEGFEDLAALVRYLLIQWKQAVDRKWDVKPRSAGAPTPVQPRKRRRKQHRLDQATYYEKNRDKILAKAREKRLEEGPPKRRGRSYAAFRRNGEKIMWGSIFFAAYDESSHTVTRVKPISVLARARIDALFANPPEYDAPGKYIAPARGEDSIPSDPH